MNEFPKLKTGAVLQYPANKRVDYSTQVMRFLDGSEQRFRDFGTSVRFWTIGLDRLTEEEMRQVQDFFEAKQGRFGSFSFVDPWDGAEYPDCSFVDDALGLQYREIANGRVSVVIRNNKV